MKTNKDIFTIKVRELGAGKYSVGGGVVVSRKMMVRFIFILIGLLITGLIVANKLEPSWIPLIIEYLKHLA